MITYLTCFQKNGLAVNKYTLFFNIQLRKKKYVKKTSSKSDRVSDDVSTNVNISRPFNVDCYENKNVWKGNGKISISTTTVNQYIYTYICFVCVPSVPEIRYISRDKLWVKKIGRKVRRNGLWMWLWSFLFSFPYSIHLYLDFPSEHVLGPPLSISGIARPAVLSRSPHFRWD